MSLCFGDGCFKFLDESTGAMVCANGHIFCGGCVTVNGNTCGTCHEHTGDDGELMTELDFENQPAPLYCPKPNCEAIFSTAIHLLAHMLSTIGHLPKIHGCRFCDYRSANSQTFEQEHAHSVANSRNAQICSSHSTPYGPAVTVQSVMHGMTMEHVGSVGYDSTVATMRHLHTVGAPEASIRAHYGNPIYQPLVTAIFEPAPPVYGQYAPLPPVGVLVPNYVG